MGWNARLRVRYLLLTRYEDIVCLYAVVLTVVTHFKNNPGEIRGATEIRPQRSAVNVEHWHLDGTVIQGRGFRVGIGINLGAFFACLGVFLLYLGAVCFYIGALLST